MTGSCLSKRYKIITLGCKVNQCETASIQERFASEDFQPTEDSLEADIIIVNTCIVTQRASYQSRQAIRRAIKENPSAKIAVVGCYPQVFPEELKRIEGIHLLAGNTDKVGIVDILINSDPDPLNSGHVRGTGEKNHFDTAPAKRFMERTRAFLKIQDGCDSFCSYCIVPYARGPIKSMKQDYVTKAIATFSEEGYKEIVLTGIHLGKYGKELTGKSELVSLLKLIAKQAPPLRVRLSSLEPGEISDELIHMVATEPWLCRHFHIPLQSGDKEILKRMNRHYTPDDYERLVIRIHEAIPDAAIGADIITGFPGEDERAFNNGYSLIEDLPISYLHVFPFSPRKGTPAAGFKGQVDTAIIKERAQKLRELGKNKKNLFYRSFIGKDVTLLAEGWESEQEKTIKGLTDNYIKVVAHSEKLVRNEFIRVTAERVHRDYLFGKIKCD
ncbi:MAG: tRNA (N(6)-L-threonylcarbamoyladenosine(37)-C(2))-methylthiotransferase MtaB [Deltaproteobacteria bacterium]|nr:tRNA (N(6)-L-threonylcarbamoyladenosine(37)-C(2))-methylthiotransferase MtaB [Deltaproteobacteria bacterium]